MSKVRNVFRKTLTYLWLIIAIGCLGVGIREVILSGFKQAWPFFGFCLVALFFFNSRRKELNKSN